MKEAAIGQRRQTMREGLVVAWTTAAFTRAAHTKQGLPPLEDVLAKFDRPRDASMRLKRAAWRDWALTAQAKGFNVRIEERTH